MSCKHINTTEEPSGNKIHYAKLVCNDCHKFVKWISDPKKVALKEFKKKVWTSTDNVWGAFSNRANRAKSK